MTAPNMYTINTVAFVFVFIAGLCTLDAKLSIWNKGNNSDRTNYDYLVQFFEDNATFMNYADSVTLKNKLAKVISSNERMFSEKENIISICENSSLKLLQEQLIDSQTYSKEMSTLRESIESWNNNLFEIQNSSDVGTLDKFLLFIEYIKSKIFEMKFCIKLFTNLRDDIDGKFKTDLSINRKKSACMKLYDEINIKLSEKLPENLTKGVGNYGSEMKEMLEFVINSINDDLSDNINRVNSYNQIFRIVLFLNEYREKLKVYNQLKENLNFDNLLGRRQVEMLVDVNLIDKFVDLSPYLSLDTIFFTSPLSKLVLQELLKAKELLENIDSCSKYKNISLPLRKKLIFMIKSVGDVIVSYEKSFQKLHSVIDTVNEVNIIFDKCIVNLCTYDVQNSDKLTAGNGVRQLIEHPYLPKFSAISQRESNIILKAGFSIGNRNNRGLPYFPESRKEKYVENSLKLSLNDVNDLVNLINVLSNEIDNTEKYIESSTKAILSSLEKIKFTNKVYSEILESCSEKDSVPASVYSFSYVLYLEIVMHLKKNQNKSKLEANSTSIRSESLKKTSTQVLRDYLDIDAKHKFISESDQLRIKVLDNISSLRQTISDKKKSRKLNKLKLPSTSKKIRDQILTPLVSVEDHVSNINKSKNEVIKKLDMLENKILKATTNMATQRDNLDSIDNHNFEKYLEPLNLIMKCYVESESNRNYERCKEIIIQAPKLLSYINQQMRSNEANKREQLEISNKTEEFILVLVREWNVYLTWIKNTIEIYKDQISTIDELDNSLRIILE